MADYTAKLTLATAKARSSASIKNCVLCALLEAVVLTCSSQSNPVGGDTFYHLRSVFSYLVNVSVSALGDEFFLQMDASLLRLGSVLKL